jgi:hypothetical protein
MNMPLPFEASFSSGKALDLENESKTIACQHQPLKVLFKEERFDQTFYGFCKRTPKEQNVFNNI